LRAKTDSTEEEEAGMSHAMLSTGENCVAASLRTLSDHVELERIVRADLYLMGLLRTAREINLPQCRVVAGCIYQSVWNVLTGRPQGTGINDYDLIYFDISDISEGAEKVIETSVQSRLPAFPAPIEVRNQARVHLWFEAHFGIAYPPLQSADEAITRYASATHAVGVRLLQDDQLDIFAPFGLEDIFAMVIRPNYALSNRETHERKAARAKSVWQEVTIVPWD
jgi:uncharacterized protein